MNSTSMKPPKTLGWHCLIFWQSKNTAESLILLCGSFFCFLPLMTFTWRAISCLVLNLMTRNKLIAGLFSPQFQGKPIVSVQLQVKVCSANLIMKNENHMFSLYNYNILEFWRNMNYILLKWMNHRVIMKDELRMDTSAASIAHC